MGHHLIGLYVNGNKVHQFRSSIVGGMIERGEPLIAIITDSSQDQAFRIDILLNRPLKSGERLPLLDPVSEIFGKSAQMVRPGNKGPAAQRKRIEKLLSAEANSDCHANVSCILPVHELSFTIIQAFRYDQLSLYGPA